MMQNDWRDATLSTHVDKPLGCVNWHGDAQLNPTQE